METEKFFLEILPPPFPSASAIRFMYMCTIIMHILCEWQAEARGGGGEREKAAKKQTEK